MSQILIAAITASLAAWLTATLALRRFRSEKVWERKVDAYTAIFHALHNMLRWFDEHWAAIERGRDIPDAEQQKLQEDFQKGKADLLLRLGRDGWVISRASSSRLAQMERELEIPSSEDYDFISYTDRGSWVISSAQKDLQMLARVDLGLDRDLQWAWRRIADWRRKATPNPPDLP